MFIPLMHQRMQEALVGAPDVLETLLGALDASDPAWDARPNPERFTLREIVAHLADYEVLWRTRLEQTRDEDDPRWERTDPGQLALANDYAHLDPKESLARLRANRTELVELLRTFSSDEWQRTGHFGTLGQLTAEEQGALVVMHDSYHTSQVAQWLAAIRS